MHLTQQKYGKYNFVFEIVTSISNDKYFIYLFIYFDLERNVLMSIIIEFTA